MLIGFPSRGLVGGVAASYVIEELKMWHFASLYDPRLPPTIVARDGTADSPIQFFVSAERCGPDGKCDKLVTCLAEVPIEPELLGDVAWTIVHWAKKSKVSHIVVLEGMESTKLPEDAGRKRRSNVRGVRSLSSRHKLDKYRVDELKDGVVSSYASAFLLAANALGMDLVAMYVEARAGLPDAHAAARLLKSVDVMLPHMDLEAEILERRSLELEKSMKRTIEQTQDQLTSLRKASEMMYQ